MDTTANKAKAKPLLNINACPTIAKKKVLERSSESPDLNSIEMQWQDQKIEINAQ